MVKAKGFRSIPVFTRYLFSFPLLLITLTQCGCRTLYIDNVSTFFIDAQVVGESGGALDQVEVLFVDTGLDVARSLRRTESLIGRTTNGALQQRFRYAWGCSSRSWLSDRDRKCDVRGTFLLRFRRRGYRDIEREYSLSDLARSAKGYEVLADVMMSDDPS